MDRKDYPLAFKTYLQALSKSPHTIKQYVLDAEQFVAHAADAVIDAALVASYADMLRATYTSANSINRKLAASRQFLLFLHSRGYVGAGLIDLLQPLPKNKSELTVYTPAQVKKIRAVFPHARMVAETEEHAWLALRNGLIVELIALYGLKPAEITEMRWPHVLLDNKLLRIRYKNAERDIEMSEAMVEAFRYYWEETKRFMPIAEEVPHIWLGIGNQQGAPITVKTTERIFHFVTNTVGFKVTATNLRYAAIKSAEEDAVLYKQFGYARKDILLERKGRMK
ncbi:MAG: site-specific integrase [Solibacillus sp.]